MMTNDTELHTTVGAFGKNKKNRFRVKENERQNQPHSYEEILDIIGFGRAQFKLVMVCGMVLLMVMNELMGISVITIASQCDFQMDDADKGVMHGILLWGKNASSYFLGYLSDKFGRRTILVYSTLAGIFFSFGTMFVTNYTVFVIFRFFIGFWTGGAVGIALAYVAEFCTSAHRPIFMNFVNISSGFSFVYVPVIAWIMLLMDWKLELFGYLVFRPWRLLIFFNVLPGLIATVVMLKYPESPKFLLVHNKREEAYEALDWVCRQNRQGCKLRDLQVYQVKDLIEIDGHINVEIDEKGGISVAIGTMCLETFALFKRPHIINFMASSLTMSGSFIISFGLAVWYPDIQNNIGSYKNSLLPQTVCDIINDSNRTNTKDFLCNDNVTTKSLIDFMVYGAMSIIAYTILGIFINRKRRKYLLISLLTIAGLCGAALVWLKNPIAIVITFSLYIVLSDLSVSTILGFLVDLFPTKLCGQGSCLVMTAARISGAVSTYIIGLYLASNCVLVFEIFAAMTLICALLAYFLNPRYGGESHDDQIP